MRLVDADRRIAELEADVRREDERANSLGARAHELNLQIESLIASDPVHVLMWWRRARRERRPRG